MGQDPEAIRQDIERTRAEMSETVEAIGYKADVPNRTKEAVQDRVEGVKETVSDKVDTVKEKIGLAKDKATDALPGGGGSSEGSSMPSPGAAVGTAKVKGQQAVGTTKVKGRQALTTTRVKGRQAVTAAKGNPIPLALGSLAVGALAGLLIPETQKEHETLGELSDNLKSAVTTTAQEAVEHGKQVAQTVASEVQSTATQTVKSEAANHGQQVAQTAQEQARQASPTSS
jgi:gas vesicle protein